MLNGLYAVEFATSRGGGTGVLFAVNQQIYGGDSAFAYFGTYGTEGKALKARVTVQRHSNAPGFFALLGTDKATVDLEGTVGPEGGKVRGATPQAPGLKIAVRLRRVQTG